MLDLSAEDFMLMNCMIGTAGFVNKAKLATLLNFQEIDRTLQCNDELNEDIITSVLNEICYFIDCFNLIHSSYDCVSECEGYRWELPILYKFAQDDLYSETKDGSQSNTVDKLKAAACDAKANCQDILSTLKINKHFDVFKAQKLNICIDVCFQNEPVPVPKTRYIEEVNIFRKNVEMANVFFLPEQRRSESFVNQFVARIIDDIYI